MNSILFWICGVLVLMGGMVLAFGIGLSNLYWYVGGIGLAGLGFYLKHIYYDEK